MKLVLLEPHHQVPTLLLNPLFVWVIGRRAQKDLPRPDVDERETVNDSRTQRRDHALIKEVTRDERVHMQPDELLPGGLASSPSADGRGREPFIFQDPPNR